MPKDGSAEAVGVAVEVMDIIVERRQKLFPDLRKLIVDYDVNPEQLNLAVNDMLNKANPARAWYRSDADAPATRVAKYPIENGMTAQVYILATWDPMAKRDSIGQKIAFESCYPPEVQERVLARWKDDFGFTQDPIVYRIVTA